MKYRLYLGAAVAALIVLMAMLWRPASQSLPSDDAQAALVPCIVLPISDRERQIDLALLREAEGRYPFALPIEVELETEGDGVWETFSDTESRWLLDISSPAAESINLGFTRYHLPEGGRLRLLTKAKEQPFRDFTAADNAAHGQLWTPMVAGDQLRLELVVPTTKRHEVELLLAKVNHGFRGLKRSGSEDKIGNGSGASCNIDVACNAATLPGVGSIIDQYRDQIRAVGAYTLGGTDQCSGSLINNTANDLTPYFLTAAHCLVTAANASTVVVYWNYENSSCRALGSSANGQAGNGPINQFNSGAIHRATFAPSDMTLIQLDDPLNPAHQPFLAGWNRSTGNFNGAFAVHHPDVGEKRFSYDSDAVITTSYFGGNQPGDGTHIRVADWDNGTTESGSSGSPLFDLNGRIIGQLHGGDAACGNNAPDWYGRFDVSWTGAGSSANRLSNWLDPLGTGVTTLNGIGLGERLSINDVTLSEGNSGIVTANLTVSLSSAKTTPVQVTMATVAGTATTGLDFIGIAPTLITIPAGQTTRSITVQIIGEVLSEPHETFEIHLSNPLGATLVDAVGRVTILNDDFAIPVVDGPLTATITQNEAFSLQITAQNTPTSWSLTGAPSGMSLAGPAGGPDSSATLTWSPTAVGTFSFSLVASNGAGSDIEPMSITVLANPLSDALDNNTVGISPGSSWFLQTATTHDGVDAAQSPPLGANQSADMSIQVNGPDTLVFWWKVSSEIGFDGVELLLDGTRQQFQTGERDWEQTSLAIPAGSHDVTWRYRKDQAVEEGLDSAWVDELILASQSPLPLFTSPNTSSALLLVPMSFQVSATGLPTQFSATGLPGNLNINPTTGLISGLPITPGTFPITLTAQNGNGSSTQTFTLNVLGPVDEGTDLPGPTWSTTGPRLWFTQYAESNDGIDAAQSGDINDNEVTAMSVSLVGPETVSFWWKVSSEATFDFLNVSVDGTLVTNISGEVDWKREVINLSSGTHVLTWSYSKDTSQSVGRDAGWVDQVVLGTQVALPDYNTLVETSNLLWQSTPAAIWNADVTTTFDGVDAARSPFIGDNQFSSLSASVLGPGYVRFRWRVSSDNADFLAFRLNGAHQQSISGIGSWATRQFALPSGTNNLEWTFSKDDSDSAGEDAAWVDQVELLGYAGWIDQSDLDAAHPNADVNSNGVQNLSEYAGADIVEIRPLMDINHVQTGQFMLHLDKPSWGVTGITYGVESSTNLMLNGWATDPATVLTNSPSAFSAESSGSPEIKFFRLRISP